MTTRRRKRRRCTKEEDTEGGWTGQKKKCIFTWSHDRPRNLIPSDRPQRRGNEATRKNNGPVVVRVTSSSSACRGSAHALEFHRGNVERWPVSLSLLVLSSPPLEKHGEESNRRVTHVTYGHVLSSRLSRSFPPRGYSILSVSQPVHLPNERIFLSEINYAENFQDLSSFLVIVESRLIQNYFMADYSIILNIKYICKCRFFNNNDLYFYEM